MAIVVCLYKGIMGIAPGHGSHGMILVSQVLFIVLGKYKYLFPLYTIIIIILDEILSLYVLVSLSM